MTTNAKLWFGFGSLTVLLVLTNAIILLRLSYVDADLRTTASVSRPRSSTAQELEISLLGYALNVRAAVETGDLKYKELAAAKATEVESYIAEYEGFAENSHQESISDGFRTRWKYLREQGDALLRSEVRPMPAAASTEFETSWTEISRFLNDELQTDANESFEARREGALQGIEGVGRYVLILMIFGAAIAVITSITVGRGILFGEREIKNSRERLRATLGSIGDAVITTDPDGGITSLNGVAETLTGWTHADAVGLSLDKVFNVVYEKTRRRSKSKSSQALGVPGILKLPSQVTLIARGGSQWPIENSVAPIRDGKESIVGYVLVFRDRSERNYEEGRVVLLARLADLARTINDPAALLFAVSKAVGDSFNVKRCLFNEIDLENDLETVGRDYCRGVKSVAGVHHISEYSPITTADMKAGKTVVNRDSKTDPRTADLYEKTYGPAGERAYVAVPLMRGGRWVASLGISDDEPRNWNLADIRLLESIGERTWLAVEKLRSDAALRESEERFAKAFNSSPLAVAITSLETGKLVEVNETFVTISGFTRDQAIGKTTVELGLWEDPADSKIELANLARDGRIRDAEYRFCVRSGEMVDGLLSAELMELAGEPCVLTVIQDITERKQAEKLLRRQADLIELSYEPVFVWDLDGGIVEWNRGAELLYGYSRAEAVGKISNDLLKTEYTGLKGTIREFLRTKGFWSGELKQKTKDGRVIFVESRHQLVESDGQALVLESNRDVTGRKESDLALLESEERRKLAQEAGNVGIWSWDIISGKTYWSESMWAIYGEKPSDIDPDEEYWSARVHEIDRERVRQNIRTAVQTTASRFRDEFRVVHKDGSVRWVESIASITRDNSGAAQRMYGVNLDITRRKEDEERVRLSENQLRLVTNAVPALISYVDRQERYRFVNQKFTDWFGLTREQLLGKKMKDVVGMRAYREIKPKIEEALIGKECTFETSLDFRSVGKRYVHVSFVPDIAADGSVLGFYGLTNDLSELKRSEELLRSTEERMGLMLETFTDYAIFSMDQTGQVESWNKGAEFIFGYSEAEIRGRSCEILFTAEDVANGVHLKEMKTARQSGRASNERWHLRKDGTRFFASGVMMPLFVGTKLTGYATIASDLTEKERRAEQLKQAHDELEIRVSERTRELAATNSALVQEMEEREIAEKQRVDLLRRLVSSQEFERQRIARDIHDQLGQRLTALRLKIASLKDASIDLPDIAVRVERLQEIAERLDSEVSFLAWELRPTALDDLGLVDAVGAFVNEWSKHAEISAEFHSSQLSNQRFNKETETHLYRITQEALNNIAKHSIANHVTVLLEKRDEDIILIIEDDGTGFDVSEERMAGESGGGLGLIGMSERASLIGGSIEIESAKGKGTAIYVRVPIYMYTEMKT